MVDVYLRSVPSDTNPNDVRLYDPTQPDAAGGGITAALVTTFSGLTITAAAVLPIAATSNATFQNLTTTTASVLPITASSSLTFGGVSLSTAAALLVTGSTAVTFTGLTVTGVAALEVSSILSTTFDDLTVTTDATVPAAPITATASVTFSDMTVSGVAVMALAVASDHTVHVLLSPIWHIPFTLPTRVLSDNAVGFLTQFVDVINGTMTATDVVTSSIANLKINVGTGSPEGSVVGSPPDIYLNRAGGASTTLYIKQSGNSTTTGWVAK